MGRSNVQNALTDSAACSTRSASLSGDGSNYEPITKEHLERLAQIGRVLIDAALKNKWVQRYMSDPNESFAWTIDGIRSHPPVRAEWEEAYVIAGLGESLALGMRKNWGQFIGIVPIEPDDFLYPRNVTYGFKENSRYNRRFEQRIKMKIRLPREFRFLVSLAKKLTKREFLALLDGDKLTPKGSSPGKSGSTAAIWRCLAITAGEFWRAAKGTIDLQIPDPPIQGSLFDEFDEDGPELIQIGIIAHDEASHRKRDEPQLLVPGGDPAAAR